MLAHDGEVRRLSYGPPGAVGQKAGEAQDNAFTYEKGVHLGEWLEPEEFRDKVYGAQAKLVRPLALGLLDGDSKKTAQRRLIQAAEQYRYRVGTGFLSTPFLLPVLTGAGEVETAYRMLENTEKPGWLAEVLDGATTIWENWGGNLSRNHYSPGAVCQWLFDTCAGIRVDGENHFTIAPIPGGTLAWAEAGYRSIYGEVKSCWEKTDSGTKFTVTIPSNTTADVTLPNGTRYSTGAGTHTFPA